ncbi:MAG: very short patch repair endonuclease [Chthoniobacterales bacterium]
MPDVFTPEKRSIVMSRIRASGNRDTELRIVSLFRAARIIGWRRSGKVFGKPDFVFPKQRVAVFVDGCFWHRHPRCKFSYTPKSRPEFWLPKFERNIARDRLVTRTLRKAGWRVVRVWECQLSPAKARHTIGRIERALSNVAQRC